MNKTILIFASVLAHIPTLAPAPAVASTHSDLRFQYESNKIQLETDSGIDIGTGNFDTSGFFQQYETNPGFASETDIGMGINPNDIIVYNVLDDLYFWDGVSFATVNTGAQIRIENNLGPDTIVARDTGVMQGSSGASQANIIDQAGTSGDFHSHVEFFLEPPTPSSPPFGAYGLKLSLSTDATGVADSDPFFIAFNFGLSGTQFDDALDAFEILLNHDPGDYDFDDDVDGQDLLLWQHGSSPNPSTVGDFDDWNTNFGSSGGPSFSAALVVPEPGAGMLTVVALISMMLTRHCRLQPFKC